MVLEQLVSIRAQKASVEPQKAVTGPGAAVMSWGIPISDAARGPHQMMREAQAVYARGNRWVRRAEMTISGRVGSVPWHLETDDGETINDDSPENLQAYRDLFEKPLGDEAGTYPGQPRTRREAWGLTSRHMGLCNVGFWYLDEIDRAIGWPKRIFFIRPDRMTPDEKSGRLEGWVLDADKNGGTALSLEQVLPFYLDPPDKGHFGVGLVESIMTTTPLPNAIDRHAIDTLGSGGRLPGMYSPKEVTTDDVFDRVVTDLRTIKDLPDSSKRDLVARAPMEFTPTAADMDSLVVESLSRMSRDDTLAHWGVPLSTIGGYTPAGMNSGETRKYDEAALWQNAVQFRTTALFETIQYGLLDRLKGIGISLTLVIEEPTFDDDAPKYDLISKSQNLPMTNNERRALIGLDPFEDPTLGNAIVLPMQIVEYGTSVSSRPADDIPLEGIEGDELQPGKAAADVAVRNTAQITRAMQPVRDRAESALERDVRKVLDRMKAEISKRVESKHDHLERKPGDTAIWWNEGKWRAELERAIKPHLSNAADSAAERVSTMIEGKRVD